MPYDILESELETLIQEFAQIEEIVIPRDPKDYTTGYAFVYLKKEKDVDFVVEMTDRRSIRGREVRVRKYGK